MPWLETSRAIWAALAVLVWLAVCLRAWRGWRGGQPGAPAHDCLPVAYASQGGQARAIAERSAAQLCAAGLPARAVPLETLDLDCPPPRLLLVASTCGDGEAPDHVARFMHRLAQPVPALHAMEYALLGLGDRHYPQFCAFARRLDQRLQALGARALFDRLEANRLDPMALRRWQQQLGQLAGHAGLSDWQPADYQPWTLLERRYLNPGSQGAPLFLVTLGAPPGGVDWQAGDIAEILPPPRDGQQGARDYSIASLPADGQLQLLVRLQRHPDGRLGLGSGWLCRHATPGAAIDLRIRANPGFRLPADCGPLILIGNGSGLAGLRAHLRERQRLGQHGHWLLFGERNAAHDFLLREELQGWQRSGHLARLDLAFSRDPATPAYVQHRLRESADALRTWLARGATLLVCGSLDGMGREIDALLHGLLGAAGVAHLRESGRYRRDLY